MSILGFNCEIAVRLRTAVALLIARTVNSPSFRCEFDCSSVRLCETYSNIGSLIHSQAKYRPNVLISVLD